MSMKPTSLSLMPAPFDWVEIPGGEGKLPTAAYTLYGGYERHYYSLDKPAERYLIAKYPVTNAQFAMFIQAGGYKNDQWWTAEGLIARKEALYYNRRHEKVSGKPWTEPRHWNDNKFNGDTQPVVGVSWYEAVAFCLWLSDLTNERIMLPTEAQSRHAAMGDDQRKFPWGESWDCECCNNSVPPCTSDRTTPVTKYEGKGDSPFGVVDMAGNCTEYCLTDYINHTNDINSDAEIRVICGSSWGLKVDLFFPSIRRGSAIPWQSVKSLGFRISVS